MRIGVDVGGTNTDAVLMDGRRVVATYKSPTTADVGSGIVAAIRAVLDASGLGPESIKAVMIGTTHFTNAFVERKRLLPVGIIRIALPAGKGLPPLMDWPEDLKAGVGGDVALVGGGREFDGRPIAPLDEAAVAEAARRFRAKGLTAVAISSIFAPVSPDMEERAAAIVREQHPDALITLSGSIGRIGMLERENATIMNASLAEMARHVVASFHAALAELKLDCPFFVSQNDGTLMNAETVARFPVLTFASGPTNSMRGAAYLSGLTDALVIDIGGTTSDVGMLVKGFPRESSVAVDIGGVRTNFRMPDILSIGLGGGSHVRPEQGPVDGPGEVSVRVGPDSVGYRLPQEARVFGGEVLTTSDIAVAAGLASMGDPSRVAGLDRRLVTAAQAEIRRLLSGAIDRMKTSATDLPVVLVGGGAILVDGTLPGAARIVRPENGGVANAIGAAIAQIGGEVDRVYSYQELGREAAIAKAKEEAAAIAIRAGAAPGSIDIRDLEEVPLAYLPGGAVRIRAKAVGDMAGI